MSNYCIVCGARISDTNTDGIGCECRAALRKAQRSIFFKNEENSLKYNWLIEANALKDLFVKTFANVKFRSDFRNSFYNSICGSERISKKQLEVVNQMLVERAYNELSLTRKKIEEEKDAFLNEAYKVEVTREQLEVARRIIREAKK